jgi:hypothetical protein
MGIEFEICWRRAKNSFSEVGRFPNKNFSSPKNKDHGDADK